jgi:hypothetical protein
MKIFFIAIAIFAVTYTGMWLLSRKNYPVRYGISFNQNHASSLGLDWKEVYLDMLEELNPKYIRIAAMWSEVEKVEGMLDFSDIDFMMQKAEENNTKVILVVGQKAPRWPECHVPGWLKDKEESKESLLSYVKNTVERYKNSKALELWQVENEPFIKFRFGDCTNYNEDYVQDEISLVRKIDPDHGIIITDSGEMGIWRKAIKTGDYFGTTLYRVVRRPSGNIWTYDWLPPAVYRYKAKIFGQDLDKMFVSELQAEPWFTSSNPNNTPIEIQEQTMNTNRLLAHMDYAEKIGVPRAYLWGVEWWYWIKEERGDSRYWDIVKERIYKTNGG